MKRLIILGFGGYGKTIEDVVLSARLFDEIIFLDDKATDEKVMGTCGDYVNYIDENTWFYPAFGNNNLRVEWINMFINSDAQVATIIHPSAYVSSGAVVETGCAVLPQAVINTTAKVKRGCIVNFGAVVDHDVVIEKGVHLCINSVVKAYNRIAPFAKIEAGQVIFNNTFIME
ncbi:MAG: hypothetical protein IJN77_08755 [Oscillospiraceae bacterium]|nr:hypothetical protein [Oscillospiraceae bacterium]MBQ6851112.1 hypothetical protein [Oscillospiraceae bacterium]